MKGALGKIILSTHNPNAQKELDSFIQDLDKVMKTQGITTIITLHKDLGDARHELIVLPASELATNAENLKSQGYQISEASDMSQVRSGFKSFEFKNEITFGDKS